MSLRKKLVWAFVIGLVLFMVCAMFVGAGHGTGIPMTVVFPWFMLGMISLGNSLPQFLIWMLGMWQMPVYVYLGEKWKKRRLLTWIIILIVHAAAIIICLMSLQEIN